MRKIWEATNAAKIAKDNRNKDKMSSGGQRRRNKKDRFILKNDDIYKINCQSKKIRPFVEKKVIFHRIF